MADPEPDPEPDEQPDPEPARAMTPADAWPFIQKIIG
jgi:hypothetical protein